MRSAACRGSAALPAGGQQHCRASQLSAPVADHTQQALPQALCALNVPPSCSLARPPTLRPGKPWQSARKHAFDHDMDAALLQVHYSNFAGLAGEQDSSGLRLVYTPRLRRHDMGVLTLGVTGFTIPPRSPAFALPPSVIPGAAHGQSPSRQAASPHHPDEH